MNVSALYRGRVRNRPDSEHHQALLRVAIVGLLLFNTAWVAIADPARAVRLWSINGSSVVFSVLLLARILQRPHASPRRRVAGAIHDNLAVTAWLYSCGPLGALALFVYPFVTVGNGFRFGVRYLAFSGALGAAGIATLIASAPGWTEFQTIGAGIFLNHAVVTVYTGVLLGKLRQAQDKLERLASCDPLTGLPNRRLFLDRLAALTASERASLACLYLDLDGFKAVNDRCGHQVGDELLTQVATAVQGCIRGSDMLARMGGDEFTVAIPGAAGPAEAQAVADRIIRSIEGITRVGGHAVQVSASVGVLFLPAEGRERPARPEELLKAADEAMYVAKRAGKGCYRLAERLASPALSPG